MSAAGKKKPKKKRNRLLVVALLCLAVYAVVSLTSRQMELNERRQALDEINARISAQARENEVLEERLTNSDTFLEEQARDNGLARPGEMIFQETPGAETA